MSIKHKINTVTPEVIRIIGQMINPLILTLKKEREHLLVFYFHGLYESTSQKELHHVDPQNNITSLQLAEFIEYFLHHKYCFIKPEDLSKTLPPGKRYAMITFDDGYFNNILAVDVLNKYKIPATFFLSTSYIKEGKSYWWDIIYKYRFKQGVLLTNIRKEQQYLKKYKWQEIDAYIEKEFTNRAFKPWSDIDRPFTELEIGRIANNPLISIGNHTAHHIIVTNYNSSEIKEEINNCNKTIFELTGKNTISIAFPNGNFDSQTLNIVDELGFKFAFTTRNKMNKLPLKNDQTVCIDRFMAKPENVKKYASFVRLDYNANDFYRNLKRRFIPLKNQ